MLSDSGNQKDALVERLAESLALRATGAVDWTIEANAIDPICRPRVSVVITVFNYARFLPQCVGSVAASKDVPGGLEVVIVDDGSADESIAVSRELIASLPFAATIVAKYRNTGLADSRNVGNATARGDFILTLDADNWIAPGCLRALMEALESPGIAAAYPILEKIDATSGKRVGRLSTGEWDPRELVRGPFIDALALFRRDALEAVGGYSCDMLHGWEDYDLWLKLAAAGYSCVRVPEVLGCYRVHDASMLRQTDRYVLDMARAFERKFAGLVARFPDLERVFGFLPQIPQVSVPARPGSASPLRRIDARPLQLSRVGVSAVIVARNERERLPHLLDHHRRLGVDRFLVIDNSSSDGSVCYLLEQADVHVLSTAASYQAARLGIDWIERVLDEFCADTWCLILDCDELFVYPGCHVTPIGRFCEQLMGRHLSCLATMFIDLYGDGPIADTHLQQNASPLDSCSWFNGTGYVRIPTGGRVPRIFGGARARLFWPDVDLATQAAGLEDAARNGLDEAAYCRAYPDVEAVVNAGEILSCATLQALRQTRAADRRGQACRGLERGGVPSIASRRRPSGPHRGVSERTRTLRPIRSI